MRADNHYFPIVSATLMLFWAALTGCSSKPAETAPDRSAAAKALFEDTTKMFHTPSAEAKGAEKARLQNEAAARYEQLLKKFPEQQYWAAQARHGLGNIRAAQGQLDQAVKHYAAVEKDYPEQKWEVLTCWKSAADLLFEAGRREEAKAFYRKIVNRFDVAQASPIEKAIIRGSKMHLDGGDLPREK